MKILASDFDNTLFVEDKNIVTENIKAIKKFLLQGNVFCIITGRNYSDIKIELNKYQIPYTYLICEDGAKIFNNMDYCLKTELIPFEKVEALIKILEEDKSDYYLDDGYNQTQNSKDCVKIAISFQDRKKAEELLEYIQSQLEVYAYMSAKYINIINDSVNKSNSLKNLLQLENLSEKDLYVIGDETNDFEMLQTYKGAIMKNHAPILDKLNKKEYDHLYQYIEELSKN